MDSAVWIAALGGLFGLFPLVLGGSFWASYRGMIKNVQERVKILEQRDIEKQARIDKLEKEYFEEKIARARTQERLDHYVAIAQIAQLELERLKEQNNKYQEVMATVIKQISKQLYVEFEDDGLDSEPGLASA